jgi:hypothetical protein
MHIAIRKCSYVSPWDMLRYILLELC